MKSLSIVILVMAVPLACNGDVSESRNHKLPLGSSLTIPSPVQSLQPPTFENPIKDYTVGLVPPPVDNQLTRTFSKADHQQQQQHHHHHHHRLLQVPVPAPVLRQTTFSAAPKFIAPPVPSKAVLQQRAGSSYTPSHHHTHHSASPVQPQVYQPKTVVHRQYQQPSIHHHNHHSHHAQFHPSSYTISPVMSQPIQQHSHHISVSTPVDYYTPITHPAVHQHSGSVYYASAPVHRLRIAAEHIHPIAHQSTVVPPSGARIIQTYPSVSYAVTAPQHGSTLSLPTNKLEPDLVYVISEVLHRHHV